MTDALSLRHVDHDAVTARGKPTRLTIASWVSGATGDRIAKPDHDPAYLEAYQLEV